MLNLNWNANIDHKTGIRYGAIGINSVSPECLDMGGSGWTDESYEACKREAQFEPDYDEDEFNDHYESDGDTEYSFHDAEYDMVTILMNDLLVTRSPYYTWARLCSPCVPNAGDLNSQADEDTGYKAYCLGLDFFDDYSPCPYKVYSVETDEEITQ